MWSRRNVIRDVKLRCQKLGFTPPARTLHSFRHTFAVNYIRRDGSVFHLQKVLGHSTLEMSRRYANLSTVDLQAMHERISLLKQGYNLPNAQNAYQIDADRHSLVSYAPVRSRSVFTSKSCIGLWG